MVHLRRHLHEANGRGVLLPTADLEAEDGVVNPEAGNEATIWAVLEAPYHAIVRLQCLDENEPVSADAEHPNGAVHVTSQNRASLRIHRLWRGNQAGDAPAAAPVQEQHVIPLHRHVERAKRPIHAAGDREPREGVQVEGTRHLLGMGLDHREALARGPVVPPHHAVAHILHEPRAPALPAGNVLDVSGLGEALAAALGRDAHLPLHGDPVLKDPCIVVRLRVIDLVDRPPSQVAVLPAGDDAIGLGVVHDYLHRACVSLRSYSIGLVLVEAHELHLDEDALPQQQTAVLAACDDFAIWELHEGHDVGKLGGAKLAQVPLELQTGKRGGHLPEADVTRARGHQRARELAPADAEDVLAVGLALQEQALVGPVPDGEQVVRGAAQGGQVRPVVRGELDGSIPFLGTLPQDAVEPVRSRGVDVDVRRDARQQALLRYREEVAVGGQRDGPDAAAVSCVELPTLPGVHIDCADNVSCDVGELALRDPHQVVMLVEVESKEAHCRSTFSRQLAVRDDGLQLSSGIVIEEVDWHAPLRIFRLHLVCRVVRRVLRLYRLRPPLAQLLDDELGGGPEQHRALRAAPVLALR
mmetsp:Transcript_44670/g.127950  ORF Transcript_44670/g.127950 Transcript_44670/m.127950 type:complete len:584 (+) Transcript_44670:2350-4101(+)